jgi:hypothetical protein
MSTPFTYFVQMNATTAWLSLSPDQRHQFISETLHPIFHNYPQVTIRLYDAEAFTSSCSDIAVFESERIEDYVSLMDDLRNSKIFTVPYFDIIDVIPAIAADHLS